MPNSLEEILLKASLLCNLKPNKNPIYRLQLFFIANKDLGSKSHQSDFQRALETGVDSKGYWDNYGAKGSGEYIITDRGYNLAKDLFGSVIPIYIPVRAEDYKCEIIGNVNNISIKLETNGSNKRSTSVFINGKKCSSAKEACSIIEDNSDLILPTKGDSAVRVLYNMAIDNDFNLLWHGPILQNSGIKSTITLPPATVIEDTPLALDIAEPKETVKKIYSTYRILRDSLNARKIKLLHNYRCQLCGNSIKLFNDKLYAETHHIIPLGAPHDGPDISSNILCVCPNHHVQLDYGAIFLDRNSITIHQSHHIDDEYIKYHNEFIYGKE